MNTNQTIARVTSSLRLQWAVPADDAHGMQGTELVRRTALTDAAPDLLEALKMILANPGSPLWANVARAAIAKATAED